MIDNYFKGMEALGQLDFDAIFAQDVVIYDPVGEPPKKKEDFQKFVELLNQFLKALKITRDYQILRDNTMAVKWTMNAIGKNDRTATTEGITLFDLNEEGKIAKISAYWDDRSLIAQLKG